jgi:tetratricopeptide (TPR) repeat protein
MSHSPNAGRAVILGLLGIAAIGVVALYLGNRHRRLPPPEGAAERRRDIREAFVNPPLQGEEPEQFRALFDELGKTVRERNAARLPELFDFERMCDECDRAGLLGRAQAWRAQFVAGVQEGMVQSLIRQKEVLDWDRTEIRRVRWLVPGREAVVVARHSFSDDPGVTSKKRWWVIWNGNRWQVYDFEDLDVGFRASTVMGGIVADALGGKLGVAQAAALREASQGIWDAIAKLSAGNAPAAEEALRRGAGARLPAALEALRHLARGLVHSHQAQLAEALREFDTAEQLNSDLPILHFLRAQVYSQLDQPQKAIDHARKYIDALGPDANVYQTMGHAHESLDQHADAADCFRKALDDTPELDEALIALRPKLDVRDAGELRQRLRKMHDPDAHFDRLFNNAFWAGDCVAAEALCDGLSEIHADSVAVASARVRLKVRIGRIEEATALFRASLTKVTHQKDRDRVRLDYLYAMAAEGHGLEAYRAVPNTDAAAAFRTLADNLLDFDLDPDDRPAARKPDKELRGLIDAHRQRQPADPWLHFYTGELHMQAKDYDAAEKEFAAGMAKPLDEESQNRFRWTRVWARFQAGRGLSAYGEIGPNDQTFRQLASLFNNPEHADDLQKLIESHRNATTKDGTLPVWQGQVHWLRHEYERAVTQYRHYTPPPKEKDDEERFDEGLPWDWEQNLVRSLIRLKRFDEARRELERPTLKHHTVLRAAVAGAAGDVAGTCQELAGFAKERFFSPAPLYADPDLGPALRSDKFAPLRQKYPEPKKDEPVRKL